MHSQPAGVGGQAPPGAEVGGPGRRQKGAGDERSSGNSAPPASRARVSAAKPRPIEAGGETAQREAPPSAETPRKLSSPSSPVPFSQVRSQWPDILAAVYLRDPLAQALLRSGKPLGISGGALVMGFPSELLKEKMEKGQNIRVLRESLAQVLDQELDLRCVVLGEYEEAEPEESPPVEDGGMVATALRDFGAQVVDVGPAQEEEGEGGDG